jgi:23S rRNA (uridine2552-2'-O)-methyltransferase
VIAPLIGPKGRLIAVDLEPMSVPGFANVEVIQGDFTDPKLIGELKSRGAPFDLLLSDAAPSTSGVHFQDSARSAELGMAALALAAELLKPGGSMLVKVFAGNERELISACRLLFEEVRRLKPDASKKRSREFYLLGTGFNQLAGRRT